MTYHLTSLGIGIATERTPVPADCNVLLTFCGEKADSVCVGGRFFPIEGGTAHVPAALIEGTTPVSAYCHADRRRYPCDPLARLGERDEWIAPVPSSSESTLLLLCERLGAAGARLQGAEETLGALGEKIHKKPFTFGETK